MATPASTGSVFWAVVAIALGSASQQSFSGWGHSGQFFENTLWPHRTSPFICITDTLIETICMVKSRKTVFSKPDSPRTGTPGVRLMKLAIFVLGVLPQAVKLYSIRGIPLTQAIASAYIISQVVHALHDYDPPELDEKVTLKPVWTNKEYPREFSSVSVDNLSLINMLMGIVPHIGVLIWVWIRIGKAIHFQVSGDLKNAYDWAITSSFLLWLLYFSFQMFLAVLGRHVTRFRAPVLTFVCGCPGLLIVGSKYLGLALFLLVSMLTHGLISGLNLCASKFSTGLENKSLLSNRTDGASADIVNQTAVIPPDITTPVQISRQSTTSAGHSPTPARTVTPQAGSTAQESEQNERTSAGSQTPAVMPSPQLGNSASSSTRDDKSVKDVLSAAGYRLFRLLFRLLRQFFAVGGEGMDMYFRLFEKADHSTIWMTFGAMNFITAAVAYWLLFDGSGTVSPGWNGLLG